MRKIAFVFDTGESPNITRGHVLDTTLLDDIRQRAIPEIQSASNSKLTVSGSIVLHLWIEASRHKATFYTVETSVVRILLGTTFTKKCITSINSAEKKTVLHHSLPVSILMYKKSFFLLKLFLYWLVCIWLALVSWFCFYVRDSRFLSLHAV